MARHSKFKWLFISFSLVLLLFVVVRQLLAGQEQINTVVKQAESTGIVYLNATDLVWYDGLSTAEQQIWLTELNEQLNWNEIDSVDLPKSGLLFWANQNNRLAQWRLVEMILSQKEANNKFAPDLIIDLENNENSHQLLYWLHKLAKHSARAAFLLGQLYHESDTVLALEWYAKASQSLNPRYQLAYVKYALELAKPPTQYLNLIKNNPLAKALHQQIQRYYRTSLADFTQSLTQHTVSCRKPIQLVSNDIDKLLELSYSLKVVLSGSFFEKADFCIVGQHWLTDSSVSVKDYAANNEMYFWVIQQVENQRAYRQGNLIVIPARLNSQVLGHELAHWLNFEDEYELDAFKAQQRCVVDDDKFGDAIAQNIVVIQPDYLFESKETLLNWMQLSVPWFNQIAQPTSWIEEKPEGVALKIKTVDSGVGFYLSETCNQVDLISLKPLMRSSFMQNHAYHIPKLYNDLIR